MGEFDYSFPRLRFFFFAFKVEISSRTLITTLYAKASPQWPGELLKEMESHLVQGKSRHIRRKKKSVLGTGRTENV